VVRATRYTITREKVLVKSKSKSKKPKYRTVTHKTPYQVITRDDRLVPAAPYRRRRNTWRAWSESSAGATGPFSPTTAAKLRGGDARLTRRARGIPQDQATVARMFFSCSPVWNPELYQAIGQQMQRDYSPTYWFRVERAEQLLALDRQIRPHLSCWRSNTRASSRSARRTGSRSGSSRTIWCSIAATIFTATWEPAGKGIRPAGLLRLFAQDRGGRSVGF